MPRLVFAAALALAAGCRPGADVVGSGTVVTETREVEPFHAVDLTGVGGLILSRGDASKVEVEGDDNLLPLVRCEVEDGVLRLGFRPGASVRPRQPPVFRVRVAILDAVAVSGAAKVIAVAPLTVDRLDVSVAGAADADIENLTAGALAVRVTGAGTVRVAGTADEFTVLINGSADVRAAGLKAKAVAVTVAGSGAVAVWAAEKLTAEVSGSGSVRYKGGPAEVTQTVSGSGSVRRVE